MQSFLQAILFISICLAPVTRVLKKATDIKLLFIIITAS